MNEHDLILTTFERTKELSEEDNKRKKYMKEKQTAFLIEWLFNNFDFKVRNVFISAKTRRTILI